MITVSRNTVVHLYWQTFHYQIIFVNELISRVPFHYLQYICKNPYCSACRHSVIVFQVVYCRCFLQALLYSQIQRCWPSFKHPTFTFSLPNPDPTSFHTQYIYTLLVLTIPRACNTLPISLFKSLCLTQPSNTIGIVCRSSRIHFITFHMTYFTNHDLFHHISRTANWCRSFYYHKKIFQVCYAWIPVLLLHNTLTEHW